MIAQICHRCRFFIRCAFVLSLIVSTCPGAADSIDTADADVPVLAVAGFESKIPTNRARMAAKVLGDQVQAVLVGTIGISLVERQKLDLIREEREAHMFPSLTVSDSLAAGRWVGADWIVTGELGRDSSDRPQLSLELVDVQDADVLAATTVAASDRSGDFGVVESSVLEKALQRLVAEARVTWKSNTKAKVVLAPLFFEHTGRLRNLESLSSSFFDGLHDQCLGRADVRILRFPRVAATQDELEMRVFGLTSSTIRQNGPPVVFLWGDFAERDVDGKAPEAVPMRASVWLVGRNAARKLNAEAPRAEFEEMVRTLVEQAVQTSLSLAANENVQTCPPVEMAGELRRQAAELMAEHSIRRRSAATKDESLIRLALHIQALYEIASFLAPEDGELRREALMNRGNLVFLHASRSLAPNQKTNQLWRRFEESFPGFQNGGTVFAALQTALQLLDGRNFLDRPRDEPEEQLRATRLSMQRDILERMERMGPELLRADSHTGLLIAHQHAFDTPELRARFVELLWPVFVEHCVRVNDLGEKKAQWAEILKEIFAAAGRPERAVELLDMPTDSFPKRRPKEEPHLPDDQRFLVRRADILPPILEITPRTIPLVEKDHEVSALHFDGRTLWVGVDHEFGQPSFQSLLLRYDRGDASPGQNAVPLPSSINSITTGGGFVWCATRLHGISQIQPDSGQIRRQWNIDAGLPTNEIKTILWKEGRLLAGGGERHRGHLFQISPEKEGAVILPVFDWDEELAGWRAHEKEKSQPGSVTLLLRDHEKTLAVAGGNQPLLWGKDPGQSQNLLQAALNGEERYGVSGQNGKVLCAGSDAGGWWLGTSAGLARFSPDGTILQRWSPGRGPYFFHAKHWVPYFRKKGNLRAFFSMKTRLAGAVTAIAADGELLFLTTSTEKDKYLPSSVEGAHLYVLHIPSGRWVGRVPLPNKATAIAQDEKRLWIGMKDHPTPLLEFDKESFTKISPEWHVADNPSPEEVTDAIAALTPREQACYAFFQGDYARIVELLGEKKPSDADLGELFLMAFANDPDALNQPDVSRRYFEEVLARDPHSFWAEEARRGLKALPPAQP